MTQTPAFKLYPWIIFSSNFSRCLCGVFFLWDLYKIYGEKVPHNPRFYFFLEKPSVTISYVKLLLMRLIHVLLVKNMIKSLFFDIQILPPHFGTVKSWKHIPWIHLLWRKDFTTSTLICHHIEGAFMASWIYCSLENPASTLD